MEQENSFFAIIPTEVLYDKNLPANAKLLYAQVSSFTRKEGYCYATNAQLGEILDLSDDRVSRLLHLLENEGYLKIYVERDDRNYVVCRKIFLNLSVKITGGDGKNNDTLPLKIPNPPVKKDKDNNIIINNINNNNINSESKETQVKTSGSKSRSGTKYSAFEYSLCIDEAVSNQKKLAEKDSKVIIDNYSIQTWRRILKPLYDEYGVEGTLEGIRNSMNFDWLITIAHYSFNALFSNKIFPKCVKCSFENPYQSAQKQPAFTDISSQNYTEKF